MALTGSLSAAALPELEMFRLDAGKKESYELKPETRYVALYFSASWCGPCRKTTPSLVAEYQRMLEKEKLPVEIVLVGSDRSAKAVEDYMKNYHMRWPALEWEAIPGVNSFAPAGIPYLVLVERETGQVISKGTGPSGVEAVVTRMREFTGVATEEPFKAGSFADRYGLLIAVALSCVAIFLFQKWRGRNEQDS
ncbi:redoxin domain-containing protein [Verrucomicrobiaceae bacterium R5-34]|nr:redoxin domain-containing protein [Verrucomicrobiaceae bacterium R5-34]